MPLAEALRTNRLIFWTGARHSGKTTAAAKLAAQLHSEDFQVAGLLAPAVYKNDELVGFEAVDLRSGARAHLAYHITNPRTARKFEFTKEGKKLGKAALSPAAVRSAECVIVDEFGPIELAGKGWRQDVEWLLKSTAAVVLLVVRNELVGKVEQLYCNYAGCRIPADSADSIKKVCDVLGQHRATMRENDSV